MVAKADKRNSLIILYENDCNNKVQDFITSNNFTHIPHDITKNFQRNIRTAVSECEDIIPKDIKWKYISLNPISPRIRDLVKIHKRNSPIRPIINWWNAPA